MWVEQAICPPTGTPGFAGNLVTPSTKEEGRELNAEAPASRPDLQEQGYSPHPCRFRLARNLLLSRHVCTELHRGVLNLTAARAQSNCNDRSGDNDSALHSLSPVVFRRAKN
jgi:hypothetical protein